MSDIERRIQEHISQTGETLRTLKQNCAGEIERIGELLLACLESGGRIYLCGNGGSAADAQHLAAELVVQYETERTPQPAMALTTDTSVLTAASNDFGFDRSFERQVRALVEEGDALIAISTSGTSANVLRAAEAGREKGATVIGFTGRDGGDMDDSCDLVLNVPDDRTAHIQEAHITAGHILCGFIEDRRPRR